MAYAYDTEGFVKCRYRTSSSVPNIDIRHIDNLVSSLIISSQVSISIEDEETLPTFHHMKAVLAIKVGPFEKGTMFDDLEVRITARYPNSNKNGRFSVLGWDPTYKGQKIRPKGHVYIDDEDYMSYDLTSYFNINLSIGIRE